MSPGNVRQVPREGSRKATEANRRVARAPITGKGALVARKEGPAGPVASWVDAWLPTVARVVLGLVVAWFGAHELLQPTLWTGYVPILAPTSTLAIWAVLAHGGVLLVLAVALVFGVAPRTAGAVTALLMIEIVVGLGVRGLSDIVVRDLGVLGLALAVSAQRHQRLVLNK